MSGYRAIMLSDARYNRLVVEARRRGFEVKRGMRSQIGAFVEWLIENAPAQEGEAMNEIPVLEAQQDGRGVGSTD